MATQFARQNAVLISFTTDGPLPAAEFQEWLERLSEDGVTGFLSCAVGTIDFTSVQRSMSAAHVKRLGIRTSVVTDDRVGRGIATAVSWLGADIRAFSWSDAHLAAAHLGLRQPEAQQKAVATVWELRRRAG